MRPSADNLKHQLRGLVREAVWLVTTRHEPGDRPDICLFATRRGGSTWLMEIIAANRGVRFLDQPTSIQTATITAAGARHIPKFDSAMIAHLDADQEERFRPFFDAVLSGTLPIGAPVRFWQRSFDFRSDRLVLKLVGANGIIDWVDANYDVDIVYLTRHPIPQSLSCIRNGWTLTAGGFLRHPGFVDAHLDAEQLAWCHKVLDTGTPLEQFVLNWGLENLAPLRLLPSRPQWLHLSYEECVLEPEAVIDRLAARLRLDDVDAMRRQAAASSRSTRRLSTGTTKDAIARGDRHRLVEGWRRHVSPDEEDAAFAVLDRLGIDLYRRGEAAPLPPG